MIKSNNIAYILAVIIYVIAFRALVIQCDQLVLTPYIEANKTIEAKSLSEVKSIPNAPKIQSYSGFLTTDKKYNSNLFFWFFPAFKNPKTAPVVVYLEGGPGTSSLFSLFLFGPLQVDKNLNLTIRPYAWTQEFSVLYIDSPVGTGFSYTDNEMGFSTNESSVADNLYEFLIQFYKLFDEYKANELYISGESYAGKYCPAIGYKLWQMSDKSGLNFKGIVIGNGWTDPVNQINYATFLKSNGLIDEREANVIRKREDRIRSETKAKNYLKALQLYKELLGSKLSYFINATGYLMVFDVTQSKELFEDSQYLIKYLNLNQTREAIHVGHVNYIMANQIVFDRLSEDCFKSMEPNMTALIANYKVMLFNGNRDMNVNVNAINGMLENSEWKYYNDYYTAKRIIWRVNSTDPEVAGYVKSFANFTHVIVRNAEHAANLDQPRAVLDLLKRFIYSKSFDN